MLGDRYRAVVKSSAYRSATTKCTGKVIRQSINLKLRTVLLFVELKWHWQFWRNNMILSVQVLVKVVGVKLLKVFNVEITVF